MATSKRALLIGLLIATALFAPAATKAETPPPAKVNVAPLATVTSRPYCGTLRYLTDGVIPTAKIGSMSATGTEFTVSAGDGSIGTFAVFPYRTSRQQIMFTFDAAISVSGVRFHQLGAHAPSYDIDGDTDGDGTFETSLAKRKNTAKPNAWETCDFKSAGSFKAIRFTATSTKGRGGPFVSEFQILSDKTASAKLARASSPRSTAAAMTFDTPKQPPITRAPAEMRYQLGTCGSMWMFLDTARPYQKRGLNTVAVKSMKDIGLDRARLFTGLNPPSLEHVTFPKNPKYRSRIFPHMPKPWGGRLSQPWPSEVYIGYEENILKRLAEDLRRFGLGMGCIPPRNIPPFDTRSGFYPMRQSDKVRPGDGEEVIYPCATNGDFFGPAFRQVMRELAGSSLASVDVTPDEFYISVHGIKTLPKDDPCRAMFKQRYNLDVPTKVEDTEQYRKWMRFQYESTADLFGSFVRAAKKANPEIVTEANLSVSPLLHFNQTNSGLAVDIVGHRSGIDVLGTDPYYRAIDTGGHYQMSRTALMYEAAAPNRQTAMMIPASTRSFKPFREPVWAFGNATTMLMREVENIDFYRLDYYANISLKSGPNPSTKYYKAFAQMVHRLENEGLKKAHTPKAVALLYSRAGGDWWQTRQYIAATKKRGRHPSPQNAISGHVHHIAVMDLLMQKGYPYRMYFLDQPETLQKIVDCKVLVIPFAYSLSKESLAILKQARARGARVLLVSKHLGETNEFGTPHKQPLLKDLVGQDGVAFLNLDLFNNGTDPKVQKRLLDALNNLLDKDRPLTVEHAGRDVEATLLEGLDGKRFVFFVNWDYNAVDLNIALPLPKGRYQVTRYDMAGVSSAKLNDKSVMTSEELARFQMKLAGQETVVLMVSPAR